MKRALITIRDVYGRTWIVPVIVPDEAAAEGGGEPQSLDKLYVMASPLQVIDFRIISE